jgi:hypothetical protein
VPLTHVPKSTVALDANAYAEQISDELINRGIARRDWDGTLVFGPSPDAIEAQIADAVQRATSAASRSPSSSSSSSSSDAGPTSWGEFADIWGGTLQEMTMAEWDLGEATSVANSQAPAREELHEEHQTRYNELVAAETRRRQDAGDAPLDPVRDSDVYERLRKEADDEFAGRYAELDQNVRSAAQTGGGGAGGGAGGPGRGTSQQQAGEIRSAGDFGGEWLLAAQDLFGVSYYHDFTQEEERDILGAFGRSDAGATGGQGPASGAAARAGAAQAHTGDDNQAQSGRAEINPDDIDLDALARRLWERIRTNLRGELLVDRERSGKLTDFR